MDAAVAGIDRRFIDLCIFELMASDNRSVEEALSVYNESLFSVDVGVSPVIEVMSDSVRQLLAAIVSQTCPGQPSCSDRGTCQDSVCTCDTGKTLRRNKPPL